MSQATLRGPRVTEYYGLGLRQGSLEFVDVPVMGDIPLFIDPYAMRATDTDWTRECAFLIQSFFRTVVQAIKERRTADARALLGHLREPNETHFGYSQGRAKGHGLGQGELAAAVMEALAASKAIRSGLLADLEDTVLMVPGIDKDVVSDISTNLIRKPLIEFTQAMAEKHGIPMEDGIPSGVLWDPYAKEWTPSRFVRLPLTPTGKLLLVPKAVVRRTLSVNVAQYVTDYIIPYLADREMSAQSSLVKLLKSGEPRVLRKDLEEAYVLGKEMVASLTVDNPSLLRRYHDSTDRRPKPPLDHAELAAVVGDDPPDWDALLRAVTSVRPGPAGATRYHRAVFDLLSQLFHPGLIFPFIEREVDEKRKRIDITFTNAHIDDFWGWLTKSYFAPNVLAECKNYNKDIGNPELDQLIGRFSKLRGEVGLLVLRASQDRKTLTARCRDHALQGRGFIIYLEDDDLARLVDLRKVGDRAGIFAFLKERFDSLVM